MHYSKYTVTKYAASMKTKPLHPRFGVEVPEVLLSAVTADSGYLDLRELFDHHSLLLFRGQQLSDEQHLAFGQLFGPIEDRTRGANGPDPVVSLVSNVDESGRTVDEHGLQVLHLKANQLWHTDSTFLPVPALANILIARTVTSSGGETELVSTRVAWRDMPEALRQRVRHKVFHHRYAHSRQQVSNELAEQPLFTMWGDQRWRALWSNPVNGEEALYIASHVFAVEGMGDSEGKALVDELIEFTTQEQYVYSHTWRVGDVLLWDERATMHRGRPWPYHEVRTLSSICVSARAIDGLDRVRPD